MQLRTSKKPWNKMLSHYFPSKEAYCHELHGFVRIFLKKFRFECELILGGSVCVAKISLDVPIINVSKNEAWSTISIACLPLGATKMYASTYCKISDYLLSLESSRIFFVVGDSPCRFEFNNSIVDDSGAIFFCSSHSYNFLVKVSEIPPNLNSSPFAVLTVISFCC